ncbi:MAG: hypothetical protein QOJ67_2514 [Acidimicrobiaceae bacterium]|jgi:hypothetical protein
MTTAHTRGGYSVEYDGPTPNISTSFGVRFRVLAGSDPLVVTVISIDALSYSELLSRMSWPDDEDAREGVRVALQRHGLRLTENLIRAGDVPDAYTQTERLMPLGPDEIDLLERFLVDKECSYQRSHAGDLYCAAADEDDQTVVGSEGLQRLAPTTRPACRACNLPDTDHICSHLTHPRIFARRAMGLNVPSRSVGSAFCELGRDEVSSPRLCRPGGNDCWQRLVPIDPDERSAKLAPLALHEALDFLDLAWRLAFDRPLIGLTTTAGIASLALEPSSRSEVETRLSALGDVLHQLHVADELLPAAPDKKKVTGSLNRVETCLRSRVVDAELEMALQALRTLRHVMRVRAGLQHAGARGGMETSFAQLAIEFPPQDWRVMWNELTARCVASLVALRDVVRRLALEKDNAAP